MTSTVAVTRDGSQCVTFVFMGLGDYPYRNQCDEETVCDELLTIGSVLFEMACGVRGRIIKALDPRSRGLGFDFRGADHA